MFGAVDLYQDVVIRRDRYGIPHVRAATDAGAVFGLMVAQAEDNYAQLEEDTAFAIGRASEFVGERGLGNDLRFRAFRIERLARERLSRADQGFRQIADAYADGLNHYLAKHPEVQPRIRQYEPWFFMANVDLPSNVEGVSTMRFGKPIDPQVSWPPNEDDGLFFDAGSNAWAIAPSRTKSGHATLFLNPHVGILGRGQRYECQVTSGEGWDFSGFCILGNPIPHAGFNRHLGWTHTNTSAKMADVYRLTPEIADGAEKWEDPVRIREGSELVERRFQFEATRLGPILQRGDEAYSLRLPLDRWMEFYIQKLAMTKAANLADFTRALAIGGLTYSNTTYADDRGNIAFWYGNTVPKRNPELTRAGPLDAADPRSEWQGFLSPDELPHVINPSTGWLQNCNSSPWATTIGDDNPKPEDFASYIVGDPDTARAQNSRRILAGPERFDFDRLQSLAFDTYVFTAAARIPRILAAVGSDPDLAPMAQCLRDWDLRSATDSVAAALYFETEFVAGGEGWRVRLSDDDAKLAEAFRSVVERFKKQFGTWQVTWGQINRLRRHQPFGKDHESWPVAGSNSSFGQIFAFTGPSVNGIHYGTGGNSYVALVEFGPKIRAMAVCGFGQSADPASPHFTDQAAMYAEGRLRPVWHEEADIQANLERSYSAW